MYFVIFHPGFLAFSAIVARGLTKGLLSQLAYYLAFATEKEPSQEAIFFYCTTKAKIFHVKKWMK